MELFEGETLLAQMSELISWEISYGPGSPTDAWSAEAVAQAETLSLLKTADRVRFLDGENVRLRGIVDDVTVTLDGRGRLVTLTGRGLGGLLMDNEALPAAYLQTGLRDILAAYAAPFGVSLEKSTEIPSLWNYTVAAGDSCYGALEGYTRWAAGITPRFSPTGGLLLLPAGSGNTITLGSGLPILEAEVCRKRYGVISEIVQLDTRTGKQTTYQNAAAEAEQCRRVMTSSGTGYRASGKSPEQRLRESLEERETLTLTAAGLFLAQPDDIVQISLQELGVKGEYLVTQATSSASDRGLICRLELRAWN